MTASNGDDGRKAEFIGWCMFGVIMVILLIQSC